MSTIIAFFNSMPNAFGQGLAWGIMAIGVYITYRILDVSDLFSYTQRKKSPDLLRAGD